MKLVKRPPIGLARALRSRLACAALAFYAVLAVLPFERLVLCVRSDGHVGLEVASGSARCLDCGRSADGAAEDAGCCASPEEETDGAPCRDVLVLQSIDHPEAPPSEPAPRTEPLALWTEWPRTALDLVVAEGVRLPPLRPPRPPPFQLARVLRL